MYPFPKCDDIKQIIRYNMTDIKVLADGRFKVQGKYVESLEAAKAVVDNAFKAWAKAIERNAA